MLGEFTIFASTLVGTLTLVLTSVFGGEAHNLVSELLSAGESAEVSVTQMEPDATPMVVVEKTVARHAAPTASASPIPEPETTAASETVELDDDCVAGDDLDVSANGQRVRVNVDGSEARVCASGEEGDSHIETDVESDSADVHVKQKVESSGSTNVTSKVELNVSTNSN